MKAEDTVMNKEQLEKWLWNRLDKSTKFEQFNRNFCKDLSKIQAEISFNAGIEEVVEWVEKHTTQASDVSEYINEVGHRERILFPKNYLMLNNQEWQSKLKEWGIDG